MRYQIKVRGRLDPSWSDWFSGVVITSQDDGEPVTVLEGDVPDQPALYGILNRIRDLNLVLISVIPLSDLEEQA